MTILEQLACQVQVCVAQAQKIQTLATIKVQALPMGNFSFEKALSQAGMAFICECKKASPSKGVITPDFPYLAIAKDYEAAGADCLSVLTEPKWFLGSDDYLREIAASVSISCLRKEAK